MGVPIVPVDPPAADFDHDGDIDGDDLIAWQSNFGMSDSATHAQGDSNADGDVDGNDFLTWQADHEVNRIERLVTEHRRFLTEAWHEYFDA